MTALPAGWQWLRLGDLLTKQPNRKVIQQGWSPKCHDYPATDGEWGVLKTTAIQAGRFKPEHNKQLPNALEPRPNIEVQPGDLLMTCAGPRSRCGVPALVRNTPSRLMMSGKMYRLRPDERMDSRFLEYWLLGPEAQRRIDAMKTGISDSGLNLTHGRFVELPVPVPPIAEQHRIIELLEDHLSRLDAAADYLDAARRRAIAWEASVLDDAVWGNGGSVLRVSDLLREPMRNGRSDRAVQGDQPGTRALTLTAVTRGEFTDEFTKMTSTPAEVAASLWLEPGDIFIQRSNTPELVGTAARYDGPREWAIFPDLLIRVRADEAVIDGRYLVAALRSERTHRSLRAKAKGLAGSMPKIDQSAVGGTEIPVPDRETQERIVAQLESVSYGSRALIADLTRQARKGAALRRAVLAAAFSGRLTASTSAGTVA